MTKNNLKIVKSGKNQEVEIKQKNKALEAAISQIDENFGKGSVMKLGQKAAINIESVSIMGKAGILEGGKGDIMIPSAHVFEGTADNYPFKNKLDKSLFKDDDVKVCTGTMISVLCRPMTMNTVKIRLLGSTRVSRLIFLRHASQKLEVREKIVGLLLCLKALSFHSV